ncbi:MAG: hypothetical protein K9L17_06380 [Clostridiales bacterium]|nr:hypothetical protein [Clostridiales bacterium]MCF8022298.1 hypothetical protein [Clostridiales bacterium]
MNTNTTSLVTVAIGVVVSLVGYYMTGLTGAGILGFGLAWILLGVLDMLRPSAQINEERAK